MIHTGLPCLECGREIVRDRNHGDRYDKLMFCGNSCRGTWTNRGRIRHWVGPVGKQVIAMAFSYGRITPAMAAESLGIKRRNALATLLRLWKHGRLVRVDHGVYSLPRIIEATP